MEKRGQVTIFIIVGILIVVAIILIFIFQNDLSIPSRESANPTTFIENCIEKEASYMSEGIIETGGVYYSGSNNNLFSNFSGSNLAILCTTNISRTSCTNTHPLLAEEVRLTLKEVLSSKAESCFKQYKKKYPQADISEGDLFLDISLEKGSISVKARKQVVISSEESSNSFDNFDFRIGSQLYDFIELASLIVNKEASCSCNNKDSSLGQTIFMSANGTSNPFLANKINCDADLMQMAKLYPDYSFSRENLPLGEKVYTISSLNPPLQNFSFVVKNCFQICEGPGGICYHHYHVGDVIHYSNVASSCHNQIHHYHDASGEYVID